MTRPRGTGAVLPCSMIALVLIVAGGPLYWIGIGFGIVAWVLAIVLTIVLARGATRR